MNYDDALIALASVNAVLWTGGLIVKQLDAKPTDQTRLMSDFGIATVAFGFFAPIAGLFLDSTALDAFFTAFGGLYFWDAVISVMARLYEERVYHYINVYQRVRLTLSLVNIMAIIFVALIPTKFCIALTSTLMAFIGYQALLGNLNVIGLPRENQTPQQPTEQPPWQFKQ